MIEIISSILEAEKKSDEIIKQANEKSKTILLEAESNSEKIKNKAITNYKLHRKIVLSTAESNSLDEYEKAIEKGNEEINKMVVDSEPKFNSIVDIIVNKIIG